MANNERLRGIMREELILESEKSKHKFYCPRCGRVVFLYKREKRICEGCGHYVDRSGKSLYDIGLEKMYKNSWKKFKERREMELGKEETL